MIFFLPPPPMNKRWANIKFNRLGKSDRTEITSSRRQACNAVTCWVFPWPSPTSHSLFSCFTSQFTYCLGKKKKKRSSRQRCTAAPSGLVARLKWAGHQLGHTVVILLYTWFILPIRAICVCVCLASSQTFVASAQHSPASFRFRSRAFIYSLIFFPNQWILLL